MIVFLFSALAALVVSAFTMTSMNNTVLNMQSAKENMDVTESFLVKNYEYRLLAIAAAAQNLLTHDELDTLQIKPGSPSTHDTWLNDPDFMRLRIRLIRFAEENALTYVYFYNRIDNRLQPLIDNDPSFFDAYTPSSHLLPITESAREAWNNKQISIASGEDFIDHDRLITAYAPVFNDAGDVAALVGIDIRDEQILHLRGQISELSESTHLLSSRITFLNISMVVTLLLLATGGFLTFTANRKQSAALRDALGQAEKASRAKSDFLANMSHEMRTPLNAVIGMTAIATKTNDMARKEYCLSKVEEASKHLLGVINDILDYSKIEADKFELSSNVYNFEEMLKKTCDVISFKTAEKNHLFHVHIDLDIPRLIVGDEQHTAQVAANLLSNAVKFTPDNGEIFLSAGLGESKENKPEIIITVRDTGIGITDEQKSRLFRSFEQADNTITKKFGGTGLGLAISKRIIEKMGGEITLESVLGEGTTFIVTVPFQNADVLSEPPEKNNFETIRVLVWDDDPFVRRYMSEILTRFNVSHTVAETGVLPGDPFDFCFLGCSPPYKNLNELANVIDRECKTVLMIPALDWDLVETDTKKTDIRHYMPKPVFPSDVLKTLNNLSIARDDNDNLKASENLVGLYPGRRVLLVDDVDINREIVLSLLEPTQLEIDCAENGYIAVQMYKENPDAYDIIFMDVQMPEMDGYQATKQIRAMDLPRAKKIPIIAMTANVFREDVERALASGMDAHIGKPVDFDEVIKKINEFL